MPVRIIDEARISAAQDAAIRELLCICFPADRGVFSRTRAWHGSGPAFSVILEEEGRIAGHVGVVDRTIMVGGAAVRVAGVQNVAVEPGRRGRGLAGVVLAAAMGEARARGFEAGMLFCIAGLEGMYKRSGFVGVGGRRVTRIHEGREMGLPENHVTMVLRLGGGEFPAGDIDLRGDDW